MLLRLEFGKVLAACAGTLVALPGMGQRFVCVCRCITPESAFTGGELTMTVQEYYE